MNVAALVPVKAFGDAKQRLTAVLSPDQRRRLARWSAERVIEATQGLDVFVVCDDDEVRSWATTLGAEALWTAELGLNGAVDDGVASIRAAGFDHVVVAHSDVPLARSLSSIARPDTATFVPDSRRDGTNVMSFPLATAVPASYGPGSFRRHHRWAVEVGGLPVEVRADSRLALDIDTPSDLTHPLLREVLPPWLPTIPVNPFTRR